jgi:hypothetical protein
MDKKYLKQSYSSIGIKLGGSKKSTTRKNMKTRKNRETSKKSRKYKIIKFSSLLK